MDFPVLPIFLRRSPGYHAAAELAPAKPEIGAAKRRADIVVTDKLGAQILTELKRYKGKVSIGSLTRKFAGQSIRPHAGAP